MSGKMNKATLDANRAIYEGIAGMYAFLGVLFIGAVWMNVATNPWWFTTLLTCAGCAPAAFFAWIARQFREVPNDPA